jgi:hypothetical protein
MPTVLISDYLNPIINTTTSMAGAMQAAAGGDLIEAAVTVATTAAGAHSTLTNSEVAGKFGTIGGLGSAVASAVDKLESQISVYHIPARIRRRWRRPRQIRRPSIGLNQPISS